MKRWCLLLSLAFAITLAAGAAYAMSSRNFKLDWYDPLSSAGGVQIVSSDFTGLVTAGQPVVRGGTSANYAVQMGYWSVVLKPPAPLLPSAFLPLVLRQPTPTPTPTPTVAPIPDTPVLNAITPPEASPSYAVSWSAAARAENYVLERATGPGFGDATQVYDGPNIAQQVTSEGIATYHYRVKAHNTVGDSGWSNVQLVEVCWEREPNGSTAEANGPLTVRRDCYGYPQNTNDYYYFDAGSPGEIRVTLANHGAGGGQMSLWYQSTELPDNRKATCVAMPGCTLTHVGSAGRYYVQVYTASGFNTAAPYALQATYP